MSNLEDITPEGSAAPVFSDPTPVGAVEEPIGPTVDQLRYAAYTAPDGSDAVYMKWQRGEATEQDWIDAVAAIRALYPDEPQP